jgi:uncharacterized protein (DUF302 family)
MAPGYAPELDDLKRPARELVERVANELRSAGFKVDTAIEVGDIRERESSIPLQSGVPI